MNGTWLILTAMLVCAPFIHPQGSAPPTQITPTNDTGIKSYQTYSGARENIGLANGNLSLEIPLVSLPGRNGLNLSLALQYNSKIWSPHASYSGSGDITYHWQSETNGWTVGQLGWTFNVPVINSGSIIDDANGNPIGKTPFIITLPGGGKSSIEYASAAMDSQDGSFVTLSRGGGAAIAFLKDGSQVHFPCEDCLADTMSDTNNNYISIAPSQLTDTLGRLITVATSGTYPNQTISMGFVDSNGAAQNVVLTLSGVALFQNTGGRPFQNPVTCSSCTQHIWVYQPGSGSYQMLTRIDLPGGRYYTFNYNDYGELTKITYPAGGYTKYDYVAFQHGETFWADAALNIASDFREVTAKWVCRDTTGIGGSCSQEDRTVYTPHIASPKLNNDSVDVDHYLNQTAYERTTYQFTNTDTYDNQPQYYSPRETMRSMYSADGTLVETVATQYNVDADLGRQSLPSAVIATFLNGTSSTVKKTTTSYDTYTATVLWPAGWDYQTQTPQTRTRYIDNPLQEIDYDYGQNAAGSPLRITNSTWWKARWADHVWNRILTHEIQDGSGTRASFEQLEYDNYTEGITASGAIQRGACYSGNCSNRGNQTAASRWRSTDGAMLTTRNQFDDAGNVRKTTDPGLHATSFSYGDSWADSTCPPPGATAAYLTQITNALGQNTQMKYYACTGALYSRSDQNDINAARSGTTYTYDLLNRVKTINYPDTGQESFDYHSDTLPLTVTKTTLATPDPSIVSDYFFDGLGRVTRSQLSDPEGADLSDTTYDALGRVYSVTNPYRNGASSPTDGTTYYAYDALGRTTVVTEQDGNTVQTDYTNFPTVVVTDETQRKRQSTTDALGRLTQVVEPNPRTGSLTSGSYPTYYSYDALSNLTYVNQVGDGTGARTRSFSYDSLSRLLSAQNPESGTTTYSYAADANCNPGGEELFTKADARGITTVYCYDQLHRLTYKGYSDGTLPGYFTYDTYPWGQWPNLIGRLVTVSNGQNVSHSVAYDAMGRVTLRLECLPSNCSSNPYTTSTTYDLAGHSTSLNYPSGRKITEGYNTAGRLLNVNFASFNGTTVNYPYYSGPQSTSANGWGYFPDGGEHLANFGNGLQGNTARNPRLQTTNLIVAAPANWNVNSSNFWVNKSYWLYDSASHDNGNVMTVADNLNSQRTQYFGYDWLNRIGAAWNNAPSSSADAWSGTFTPDPWGNLKQSGSYSFMPAGFDAGNHISQTGYTYDTGGNLLNDTFHNYAYDAESRIKSVDTTGATYTYDADGNRVRKDVGSDATEYIYFQGQPIAEYKPATGDWSDYIYANGKKIAKSDTFDRGLHIQGTNCSNCGWQYSNFWLANAGGLSGYTVQSGDKLYLLQYEDPGTQGGMVICFTDTCTTWNLYDQNGQVANEDADFGTVHTRIFDLSSYAGHTVAGVDFDADGNTQAGHWDVVYEHVVLVSADGTVHPIYTNENLANPIGSIDGTSGVTGRFASTDEWGGRGPYPQNGTVYYHEDHLGTSRLITSAWGWPDWQGTFLPFGQEWNSQITTNHYKFTGKERDAESSLDYFGARYYSSTMGRWMSPDWADKPEPVPYADLSDPQSLNLYGYVRNNPMSKADADGHEDLNPADWGPAPPPIQHGEWTPLDLINHHALEAAEFVPGPVGASASALDAMGSASHGNYGTAVLALAGAIPFGKEAKGAGTVIHHIASDKALVSGITHEFENLFGRAGLSLQDKVNKMSISELLHSGRHGGGYNPYVLNRLRDATKGLSGAQLKEALTKTLQDIQKTINKNPEILKLKKQG